MYGIVGQQSVASVCVKSVDTVLLFKQSLAFREYKINLRITSKEKNRAGKAPQSRLCHRFSGNIYLQLTFFLFLCFFFFYFKRINDDRLSVSQEQNAPNPAYQRYQGQHLRRSCMENPKDGLADWFVIKHTKDQSLLLDLLSKHGFVALDATQVGISKN